MYVNLGQVGCGVSNSRVQNQLDFLFNIKVNITKLGTILENKGFSKLPVKKFTTGCYSCNQEKYFSKVFFLQQ